MTGWELPVHWQTGGHSYGLHCDFRDVLEILGYLNDRELPDFVKWEVALELFYREPIPAEKRQEARAFLSLFLNGGREDAHNGEPGLIDWELDAGLIVADLNRVAGQEIRSLPFVHWWTFLSWFHAIGEGQLATVVTIRNKLRRGSKLEQWEREYYTRNRALVDRKKPYTPEEKARQDYWNRLLGD